MKFKNITSCWESKLETRKKSLRSKMRPTSLSHNTINNCTIDRPMLTQLLNKLNKFKTQIGNSMSLISMKKGIYLKRLQSSWLRLKK
jgi:hypothetical protein